MNIIDYILIAIILRFHVPTALLRCKIFISSMTQNKFHFVMLFHAIFQPIINDKNVCFANLSCQTDGI